MGIERKNINVLVACEESQEVCKAFRERGFNAFSCDLQCCSGGHPEWHILGNCLHIMHGKCFVTTMDDVGHYIDHWDLIIAHPPCTDLAVCGAPSFHKKIADGSQQRSINFFMNFVQLDCEFVAIENPIGIMSTVYRKPDQIIQPYFFGDAQRKSTCLWLYNLPKLKPTNIVEPVIIKYKNGKGNDDPWHINSLHLSKEERSKIRSKTFPGIANAMAIQWGDYIFEWFHHWERYGIL